MKHYTKEEALERAKEFNGKESCYPNKRQREVHFLPLS